MNDATLILLASLEGPGRPASSPREAKQLLASSYVNHHYWGGKQIFTLKNVAANMVAQSRTRLSSIEID